MCPREPPSQLANTSLPSGSVAPLGPELTLVVAQLPPSHVRAATGWPRKSPFGFLVFLPRVTFSPLTHGQYRCAGGIWTLHSAGGACLAWALGSPGATSTGHHSVSFSWSLCFTPVSVGFVHNQEELT